MLVKKWVSEREEMILPSVLRLPIDFAAILSEGRVQVRLTSVHLTPNHAEGSFSTKEDILRIGVFV